MSIWYRPANVVITHTEPTMTLQARILNKSRICDDVLKSCASTTTVSALCRLHPCIAVGSTVGSKILLSYLDPHTVFERVVASAEVMKTLDASIAEGAEEARSDFSCGAPANKLEPHRRCQPRALRGTLL